jgi:hypothetical protein
MPVCLLVRAPLPGRQTLHRREPTSYVYISNACDVHDNLQTALTFLELLASSSHTRVICITERFVTT